MKKKLTDEEIVKSLECCVIHRDNYPCDCGLENKICDDDNYLIEILDLIHRLQDENERLKERAKLDLECEKKWGKLMKEQAVKDTVKEILFWLIEHTFESCIIETYFRERFGVEVE